MVKKEKNRIHGQFIKVATAFILLVLILSGCRTTDKAGNDRPLKYNRAVVTGVLENGMEYYVQHNSEPQNRIQLRLVVKAGSCMEEDDQKGVAHFVEHMAFNGTQNFEKNSLIKYFESIGMNFGSDLNAYTSFNETVYQLEVPADNIEYLRTAVTILHDWACAITFDEEELNKERGVVTEEWRRGLGVGSRLRDKKLNFLATDSRYVERLPIGDMDIIANVSRTRVVDFYKKWYRPELMAVAIVGDTDTATMQNVIKDIMGTVPKSEEKISAPLYLVEPYKTKETLLFTDKEISNIEITFLSQQANYTPSTTELGFKENIGISLCYYILNKRLSNITATAASPWTSASLTQQKMADRNINYGLYFSPKEGQTEKSFKTIIDEYDKAILYGTTQEELDQAKKVFLSSVEQNYTRKDSITSSSYIGSIVDHVLTGSVYMSEDDYYVLYKKCLSQIDTSYINYITSSYITDRGNRLLIVAPENKLELTQSQLEDIWNNYHNTELKPVESSQIADKLMDRPVTKGRVAKKNKYKDLDVTEYYLDNGIRILVKKTNFEKNTVYFHSFSNGGTSLITDDEYLSSSYGPAYAVYSGVNGLDYNQMINVVSNKNCSLSIGINSYSEGFSGYFINKPENMECLFQQIYLFTTMPQFTDEGWEIVRENLYKSAKAWGTKPSDEWAKKLNDIIFDNSIRYKPFDMNAYNKLDKDIAEKVYRERFANPADFTYVFVGDFNEKSLIDMCCIYLGSMSTDPDNKENPIYERYRLPEGITKVISNTQTENRCNVFFTMRGDNEVVSDPEKKFEQDILFNLFRYLLNIKLREVIREDQGGVYGINTSAGFLEENNSGYYMSVNFSCDPIRAEELTQILVNQLNLIASEVVDQSYIDTLKETYLRDMEGQLKKNKFYLNTVIPETLIDCEYPTDYIKTYKKVLQVVTAENLNTVAQKYINTDNYLVGYLLPRE